jgi:hypothetical protein
MSSPNDTFAEKISNLLQANWSEAATGLQVSDVDWRHEKFDTMTETQNPTQKATISVYNPANPVSVEVLSAQTSFIHEAVVIDLFLHSGVLGGADNCLATREKIRQFILQVIHQNAAVLPGSALMTFEGEYGRLEGPNEQRECFKVVCSWFEVLPQ